MESEEKPAGEISQQQPETPSERPDYEDEEDDKYNIPAFLRGR